MEHTLQNVVPVFLPLLLVWATALALSLVCLVRTLRGLPIGHNMSSTGILLALVFACLGIGLGIRSIQLFFWDMLVYAVLCILPLVFHVLAIWTKLFKQQPPDDDILDA